MPPLRSRLQYLRIETCSEHSVHGCVQDPGRTARGRTCADRIKAGRYRSLSCHFTPSDGKAVLNATSWLKPDVMVVDVSMPVMNGIEAAKRLADLHPEGRIVFLSIHQSPHIIREALSTEDLMAPSARA